MKEFRPAAMSRRTAAGTFGEGGGKPVVNGPGNWCLSRMALGPEEGRHGEGRRSRRQQEKIGKPVGGQWGVGRDCLGVGGARNGGGDLGVGGCHNYLGGGGRNVKVEPARDLVDEAPSAAEAKLRLCLLTTADNGGERPWRPFPGATT